MSEPPKLKRLLSDVLEEGAESGFREQMLAQTLHLARRRRRVRQAGRASIGLATLAIISLLAWRGVHRSPGPAPLETSKPFTLVHSQPLPPTAVVQSRSLSPTQVLTSFPTRSVVTTANALVNSPKEVNDDELLTLCSPRPVVLVREDPQSAELVFLDYRP